MRAEVNTKAEKYGNGNVWLSIIKFSLPIMMLYFVGSAYQFIDSLMVAKMIKYEGTKFTGLTATVVLVPISIFAYSLIVFGSIGFGAKYSQSLGKGDKMAIKKNISAGYFFQTMCLILLILFVVIFTIPIFCLMLKGTQENIDKIGTGDNDNIIDDGISYMFIFLFVFISMSVREIITSQLRAEGHITSVSLIPLISIPVNLTLNYVLMAKDLGNMGLKGAAVASVLAEIIIYPFLIPLIWKYKKNNETHFEWNPYKFGIEKERIKSMMAVASVPFIVQGSVGLTSLITTLAFGAITNNIPADKIDGDWITWLGVASRPSYLILSSSLGLGAASISYIGYNHGAGNTQRTITAAKAVYLWSFVVMLIMFIFVASLTKQFMGIFDLDMGTSSQEGHMKTALIFWTLGTVFSQTINRFSEYTTAINRPKSGIKIMITSLWGIYMSSFIFMVIIYITTEMPYYYILYFYFIYSLLSVIICAPMIWWSTKKHKEEMLIKEN